MARKPKSSRRPSESNSLKVAVDTLSRSPCEEEKAKSRSHLRGLQIQQRSSIEVSGLPRSTFDSTQAVRAHFESYGKVCKVVVDPPALPTPKSIRDENGIGMSGGLKAYITFSSEKGALNAVRENNAKIIDGNRIRATLAMIRYCDDFLQGKHCDNLDCILLHEFAKGHSPTPKKCDNAENVSPCSVEQQPLGQTTSSNSGAAMKKKVNCWTTPRRLFQCSTNKNVAASAPTASAPSTQRGDRNRLTVLGSVQTSRTNGGATGTTHARPASSIVTPDAGSAANIAKEFDPRDSATTGRNGSVVGSSPNLPKRQLFDLLGDDACKPSVPTPGRAAAVSPQHSFASESTGGGGITNPFDSRLKSPFMIVEEASSDGDNDAVDASVEGPAVDEETDARIDSEGKVSSSLFSFGQITPAEKSKAALPPPPAVSETRKEPNNDVHSSVTTLDEAPKSACGNAPPPPGPMIGVVDAAQTTLSSSTFDRSGHGQVPGIHRQQQQQQQQQFVVDGSSRYFHASPYDYQQQQQRSSYNAAHQQPSRNQQHGWGSTAAAPASLGVGDMGSGGVVVRSVRYPPHFVPEYFVAGNQCQRQFANAAPFSHPFRHYPTIPAVHNAFGVHWHSL